MSISLLFLVVYSKTGCFNMMFSSFSDASKYAMLTALEKNSYFNESHEQLCISIIDSNEHIDSKMKCLKMLQNQSLYEFNETPDITFLLDNCNSYASLMMHAAMRNIFDMKDVVIELLRNKKYNILYEWIDDDAEGLDQWFHCVDLIRHLRKTT